MDPADKGNARSSSIDTITLCPLMDHATWPTEASTMYKSAVVDTYHEPSAEQPNKCHQPLFMTLLLDLRLSGNGIRNAVLCHDNITCKHHAPSACCSSTQRYEQLTWVQRIERLARIPLRLRPSRQSLQVRTRNVRCCITLATLDHLPKDIRFTSIIGWEQGAVLWNPEAERAVEGTCKVYNGTRQYWLRESERERAERETKSPTIRRKTL